MDKLRFLVDESTGKRLNDLLIEQGFDSLFVGDVSAGLSDELVLQKADEEERILVTDDKDFGELIFRIRKPSGGVVLFRTETTDPNLRMKILLSTIKSHSLQRNFLILTEDKIRIRKIPI
jgi:predicted nuclease of predicted toxin-antitoxin system